MRKESKALDRSVCMRSSNAEKVTVLGFYDHDLNTDRKRPLFNYN